MSHGTRQQHDRSGDTSELWADPKIQVSMEADCIYLEHERPLGQYPSTVLSHLRPGAARRPDTTFLADHSQTGDWRHIRYAQMNDLCNRVASFFLAADGGGSVAIIARNSIENAAISLGAMLAGPILAPPGGKQPHSRHGITNLIELLDRPRAGAV